MINTKLTSCFALVMLITGAIDSIRNLPTTALFGASLIFYCILAAIIFLIPIANVSAYLSREHPEMGGIYQWVKKSMGDYAGIISIWLQWINTLIWYPTILVFIAATVAYFIDPSWANNKIYLVSVVIGVFWIMSFINLFGLQISGKVASFCAIAGVFFPLMCIILLAIYWMISGHATQLTTHSHWVPHKFSMHNLAALTAIITSFLGIELATVHNKDVDESESMFPRALFISTILIIATMVLGSLAIALVLPANHISLVSGVMQTFTEFFHIIHASWLRYVMSVLIVIGSLGGMINWIISPSKGLFQAAQDGFLPKIFTMQNRCNVPNFILFLQACIVSVIALIFVMIPSINSSYWLLTDLSTELYVAMYVMLLIAAILLNYHNTGSIKTYIWSGIGLIGCLVALVVGFLPPLQIKFAMNYQLLFGISLILMLLPAIAIVLVNFLIRRNSHIELD